MMLKSKSTQPQRSTWSLLRAGLAGLAVLVGGAAATTGCLDRPVKAQEPKTSNIYVDEIRQTAVDKIDLLFMIDNSISMADKQAILAEAVPLLVQRLITPLCVRPCTEADKCSEAQARDGVPVGGNADGMTGKCAMGAPEFNPIRDIHVGVVTSSLGAHGAPSAKDVCAQDDDNDHAHLLGSVRTGLMSYENQGFLKWDTTKPAKYTPAGDSDDKTFTDKFTAMVKSASEHGCGFEASLESWYRFLIDPDPPEKITLMGNTTVREGTDQVILQQRAAFLRPDSLVAVIMLSDENDCSIRDEGYGWLIARSQSMYRSTSQCAANPNDPCCQSCVENAPNPGCPAITADAECMKGNSLPMGSDDLNLRCWQQKRRFGFELLYETQRYSKGLSANTVPNRKGEPVQNPLFAAAPGKAPRDKGLVFLAGIVGVPWQDIADEETRGTPDTLRYLNENKINWDLILGNPNTDSTMPPVNPTDPLMIETPDERMGSNPITNDAIAPSTSTGLPNKINGHEQKNVANSDLQYACIFKLTKPIECDAARDMEGGGCDCFAEDAPFNRPLCNGTTQNYAKAYPGTRHLQVLREFQDNSIVASICPKVTDDNSKPDYGYNPAVKAIISRLKEALKGKCLPRPLVPATVSSDTTGVEAGQVPCAVVEARLPAAGQGCSCDEGQKRKALTDRPELRDAVLKRLKDGNTCGSEGGTPCTDYCTCELLQLSGAELMACQNDANPPSTPGYCYINNAPNEPHVGNPDLVNDCSASEKRLLRFVGNTPAQGAVALVACLGAALGPEDTAAMTPAMP
jgi:hypothetical protein